MWKNRVPPNPDERGFARYAWPFAYKYAAKETAPVRET